jgi:hypothetical protein
MASYFRTPRNCELSLLYYLEQSFASDWSGITVVKAFKQVYTKEISLPIVCVHLAETTTTRLEIGTDTLDDRYLLMIDVFARSDAQRLDLTDYIKNKLKTGWIHYDHSHVSGDNSQLVRTENGRDYVTEFVSDTRIDIPDSEDEKDKYRNLISIRVRKSI